MKIKVPFSQDGPYFIKIETNTFAFIEKVSEITQTF